MICGIVVARVSTSLTVADDPVLTLWTLYITHSFMYRTLLVHVCSNLALEVRVRMRAVLSMYMQWHVRDSWLHYAKLVLIRTSLTLELTAVFNSVFRDRYELLTITRP